jgi:hypothetical protein
MCASGYGPFPPTTDVTGEKICSVQTWTFTLATDAHSSISKDLMSNRTAECELTDVLFDVGQVVPYTFCDLKLKDTGIWQLIAGADPKEKVVQCTVQCAYRNHLDLDQ